jgi:hypothetical protein
MRTITISTKVTKEQNQALLRIAAQKEWSLSKTANKAIEVFIKQEKAA